MRSIKYKVVPATTPVVPFKQTTYSIYSDGRVLNNKTGKFLKPFCNGKGYQKVNLMVDGKRKSFYIHRLVAEMFIKRPRKKFCDQVNHIDGDKTNNDHLNLEWVTNSENQKHKYKLLAKEVL